MYTLIEIKLSTIELIEENINLIMTFSIYRYLVKYLMKNSRGIFFLVNNTNLYIEKGFPIN